MEGMTNPNLSEDQFRWVTTKDRYGTRAYTTPRGSIVTKDGTGRTPVSVYYPGHDDWAPDATVDSIGEGKAWAEEAEKHS